MVQRIIGWVNSLQAMNMKRDVFLFTGARCKLNLFKQQSCCPVDQVGQPLKAVDPFVELVLPKKVDW